MMDDRMLDALRSTPEDYDITLGYIIDNYTKSPLQTNGQHMGNPLSFPIMGAMHNTLATEICELGSPTSYDPESRELRQLQYRLEEGKGTAIYLFGLTDDGNIYGGNKSEILDHAAEWLKIVLATPGLTIHQEELGFKDPRIPWDVKEKKNGNIEYKTSKKKGNTHGPKKTVPKANQLRVIIMQTISRTASEIIWKSDSQLNFHELTGEQGKCYESMSYRLDLRKKKTRLEIMKRPAYYWSVGDDHLGISQDPKKLSEYHGKAVTWFNQKYSQKADYISKQGLVIAEHFARVIGTGVYKEFYVKTKQIVQEHGANSKWKWMDTYTSTRTQLIKENFRESRVRKEMLYDIIENAETVSAILNRNAIHFMYRNSIDPRLPKSLGGYEITPRALPEETTKLTRRHFRNLCFLTKLSHKAAYKYGKKIRKMAKNTEVIRHEPYHRKWLSENSGDIPIEKSRIKRLLNHNVSWINSIESKTEVKQRNGETIANEISSYVNATYNDIKFHLSKYRTIDTKEGEERVYHPIDYRAMDVQNYLRNCLEDKSIVKINAKFYADLLTLEAQEESRREIISRERVLGIQEGYEKLRTIPKVTLDDIELWEW
jgi:hypothetical protein